MLIIYHRDRNLSLPLSHCNHCCVSCVSSKNILSKLLKSNKSGLALVCVSVSQLPCKLLKSLCVSLRQSALVSPL